MCEELTTNVELPERTVNCDDKNGDMKIMWLQEKFHGFANIGVTTLPGCRYKEQERNLVKDIGVANVKHFERIQVDYFLSRMAEQENIVQQKVTDVFCLVTTSEMQKFRVKQLLQMYQKYSLRVHHHPCEDGGLFPVPELIAIIDKLYHIIEDEGNPLLHCVAGKGRSCLVLAAYLMAWHRPLLSSTKAIETVQMFRMCSAFSVKQYNFLVDFPAVLDEYRKNTQSQMLASPSQGQETCNDNLTQSELPSQSESTNKEFIRQTAQEIVCSDHEVGGRIVQPSEANRKEITKGIPSYGK